MWEWIVLPVLLLIVILSIVTAKPRRNDHPDQAGGAGTGANRGSEHPGQDRPAEASTSKDSES